MIPPINKPNNKILGSKNKTWVPSTPGFKKPEVKREGPKSKLDPGSRLSSSIFVKSPLTFRRKAETTASTDKSIFKGEPEISRKELRHELRTDPQVWQAERRSGLDLSRKERADLVKDIPKIYGREITPLELKNSIKKINRKNISVKDPQEHAKIRKEVKFLKKIGGIE